jgi:SAM-dependent methyltransferase
MDEQNKSLLYEKERSSGFYENRYRQGYMDDWPIEKKRKIFEVIQDLKLPAKGEALDFGCGNGVLTEIIRQALPSWKISGTDLSAKALDNARKRYPDCTFFEINRSNSKSKKFDFIFTHHVFEHVFDLKIAFNQMNEYLKPKSSMLHFLPCGNKGSYEYNICRLRRDGINTDIENRYFFEDEGHVRRLDTDGFCRLCETKDFELCQEYYSNQYFGAIEWITSYSPKFVWRFTDISQAIDKAARLKLIRERKKLIFINLLRLPVKVVRKLRYKRNKKYKEYITLLTGITLYIFSLPIEKYIKGKARQEWDRKKTERNGSEMCLYFKRGE